MTIARPEIFSLNIETMKQKINDMVSLGYTKKELMKMIKNTPAIFGYNMENIRKK